VAAMALAVSPPPRSRASTFGCTLERTLLSEWLLDAWKDYQATLVGALSRSDPEGLCRRGKTSVECGQADAEFSG
jgi:hypothetical protein